MPFYFMVYRSSAGKTSLGLTKKQAWVLGGTAFTTMSTVLVVCLVLLVFTDSVPGADAQENKNYPISFHILDTSIGKNAAGIYSELYKNSTDGWVLIGTDTTGEDGRNTIAIYPDTMDVSTAAFDETNIVCSLYALNCVKLVGG